MTQNSTIAKSFNFLEGTRTGGATNGCMLIDASVAATSPPNNSQIFFLEKLTYHMKIMNPTNTTLTIYIYDLVANMDISVSSSDADPEVCLSNSNLDYSAPVGTAITYTTYGFSPMMSERFRRLWKVTKKAKIALNAGQLHEHDGIFKYGKRMTPLMYNANLANRCIKGVTRSVLYYIEGSPGNDASPNQSKVGLDVSNLDVVWNASWEYRWVADTTTVYTTIANALNPLQNMGTAQVMNDDSGQVNSYNAA